MANAFNATIEDNKRRRLAALHHEWHHSGTFCLGQKLAPLVMLLGCQRCGTSALHEDLMQHVQGARRGHSLHGEPEYYAREQHFFATDSWSQGVHHYLEHFPPCPPEKVAKSDFSFTTDATPAYLRKPIVATRVKEVYPSMAQPHLKFVIILRDPVKRLYGYWDTFVQKGPGAHDFNTWVDNTLAKVSACQKQHGSALWPPPDEGRCDEDTIEGVAAGLYSYQLSYWIKAFSPNQFFITSLDAYERDKARVLSDCATFVGASRDLIGNARAIGSADTQGFKVEVCWGVGRLRSSLLPDYYSLLTLLTLLPLRSPLCAHRSLFRSQWLAGRRVVGQPAAQARRVLPPA